MVLLIGFALIGAGVFQVDNGSGDGGWLAVAAGGLVLLVWLAAMLG